jgi:integrase
MAINQRGNSWQAYVVHNGQRVRATAKTKEDAQLWEVQARQALVKGLPVPTLKGSSPTTMTFQKAAHRCYLMHWKGGKSEDKQIQIIQQLENYFGKNLAISSIKTDKIDDYILHLKCNNLSGGTINRKLAALSKILSHAHDTGKLSSLPKIHRQKENEHRIRWVTKEEEQLILQTIQAWSDHDLYDGVVVSVDTGIRAGELRRIARADINEQGLYIGRTKNGNPRLVPLTSRARATLEERKKLTNSSLLFDLKDNWYRERWDKLREHLSLDDVVWHVLRHTTASRLIQGGVPITHVKEWMGHKSIATTMRYAHLAPKHLQEVVNVLE